MVILTKHVLTQPIIGVDDDKAAVFRAKGWIDATSAEIAAYARDTPYTHGNELHYPTPLILPEDIDEQGPHFSGGGE